MMEVKTRGRKETFASEEKLVSTLDSLVNDTEKKISRYLMLKLVDMGYIDVEDEVIPNRGRGRPGKLYSISNKGMAFLTSKKV
jgi:hypothetical protein